MEVVYNFQIVTYDSLAQINPLLQILITVKITIDKIAIKGYTALNPGRDKMVEIY